MKPSAPKRGIVGNLIFTVLALGFMLYVLDPVFRLSHFFMDKYWYVENSFFFGPKPEISVKYDSGTPTEQYSMALRVIIVDEKSTCAHLGKIYLETSIPENADLAPYEIPMYEAKVRNTAVLKALGVPEEALPHVRIPSTFECPPNNVGRDTLYVFFSSRPALPMPYIIDSINAAGER